MALLWDDSDHAWDQPKRGWDGGDLIGWQPPAHYLDVEGADWSCRATQVTIRHGRDDHIGQPSSGSMTVELAPTAPEALEALRIGAVVSLTVTVTHAETEETLVFPRFVGRITDVDWNLEDRTGRMICVDDSARLDRSYIGDSPWPEQTDLERADAILTAAGLDTADPAQVILTGPSHVSVPARDVDRQKAWSLLSDLAADTVGVAWVNTAGVVRFRTAPSRDVPADPFELRGCDIAYDAKWLITDDYINRVTVKNDTTEVTASDDGSIATYGLREASATVDVVDAGLPSVADRVLVAAAEPRWRFPQLVWSTDFVGDVPYESATWDSLTNTWDSQTSSWENTRVVGGWPTVSPLGLEVGDLVTVSGELPPAPQPIPDLMHVEGWVERHRPGRIDTNLFLVDRMVYVTPPPPVLNMRTTRIDDTSFSVSWELPDVPNAEGAVWAYSKAGYPDDPTTATFVAGAPDTTQTVTVTDNDQSTPTYVSAWTRSTEGLYAQRRTVEYIGQLPTTTTLTRSRSTVYVGGDPALGYHPTTVLTATVSPSNATGTVVFSGPGFTSSPVTVSGGKATYTATPTASGTMRADFTGTPTGFQWLPSSGTASITARTKTTRTASPAGVTRNYWEWKQSSGPFTVQSTFTVGGGGNLPYSEVVVTRIRMHVAAYYGNPTGRVINAGIYNGSGGALATTNVTLNVASGPDSPVSQWINITDRKLTGGTYRIGWSRTNANAIQWDYDTTAPGYTYYADGGGVASRSLLWDIEYYTWA